MLTKIRGLRLHGLDSVEKTANDGPLEKDGYYRRLQEKRKRDYKLAREKHQKWLEEQGLKWS